MIENLSRDDFEVLVICATRYALGRQTYMPSMVQEIVQSHISELTLPTLHILTEDIEFAEHMALNGAPYALGDKSIDAPGWLALKDRMKEEENRRKEAEERG